MSFLIKVVDYHNRIFYVTPTSPQGSRQVDSKNKAELFKVKSDAIEVAVSMKHTEGLQKYIYHIVEVSDLR